MKYSDKIYQYFSFSSSVYTQSINGKHKQRINITGKPNKALVMFYLIFSLVFTLMSYAMNESKFGNPVTEISRGGFLGATNQIRTNSQVFIIVVAIMVISMLIVFIKSIIVFKKLEPKSKNINLYERELPSNLRPAHVRMLINDGLVDEISLACTIVDLIDRGYLEIKSEKEAYNKLDLFGNSQITLVKTEKSTENLLRYEKYLIDWFINQYGDGKEVSQEQVHKKLLYEKDPYEKFEEWQALVVMSFNINKYFNKHKRNGIMYIIFVFLGFIPIIPLVGQFLAIYGLGCLFFTTPVYTLNQTGVDECDKWLSLKKFLNDFSDMESKTTDSVIIWEFYLTYSIALNISSIAKSEIEEFFGDNIFRGTIENTNNEMESDVKNVEDIRKLFKEAKTSLELSNKQIEAEIAEELKKYNI